MIYKWWIKLEIKYVLKLFDKYEGSWDFQEIARGWEKASEKKKIIKG